MFDAFLTLFSWLPPPLNVIAFGAVCVLVLVTIIKLIAKIIDMLPFT